MELTIETEREAPGRWIAEVPELAGVMVYGKTRADAVRKAKNLARKVLAERLQHGEPIPGRPDVQAARRLDPRIELEALS